MCDIVWLASYPKSGNTWFRMLIANLRTQGEQPVDINDIPWFGGLAADRCLFENLTFLESGVLTSDEIARLQPHVFAAFTRNEIPSEIPSDSMQLGATFFKTHDAYIRTVEGEPLLGAGKGAIVIVRDPRDVAISLAHHMLSPVDEAIAFLNSSNASFASNRRGQSRQLPQAISSWSAHVESWLDQKDIPVHLVRYEDMLTDCAGVFDTAMDFAGVTVGKEVAARTAKLASFRNLQAQEREKGFCERPAKSRLFFREGRSEAWRQNLTETQIASIEAHHAPLMKRLGYFPTCTIGVGDLRASTSRAPILHVDNSPA